MAVLLRVDFWKNKVGDKNMVFAAVMQVTTVNTHTLSADDIAVCRLAVTEVTLHTYVASNIGWSCHSYMEDVERRLFSCKSS
jgi:hypothetical protein